MSEVYEITKSFGPYSAGTQVELAPWIDEEDRMYGGRQHVQPRPEPRLHTWVILRGDCDGDAFAVPNELLRLRRNRVVT